MACRICLEPASTSEPFISACNCIGHVGNVHKKCLQQWINIRKLDKCEICKSHYDKNIVIVPQSKENRYRIMAEILLGNVLSILSCYCLWLQQQFDKQQLYNVVTIFVAFFCVMIQIVIWAYSIKNGNVEEYTVIPILWLVVFAAIEIILISVSNIWNKMWESLITFFGVASIHVLSCFMMSCTSMIIKCRTIH